MGVKVVETSLRDGHQSLFATRMNTDEVLLALQELDQVVVIQSHLFKIGQNDLSKIRAV